jgi:hypothetical protein
MSQRPTTFGQLLRRLASTEAAAAYDFGPVIASAREEAPSPAGGSSPRWVILHSITDYELRLIHPRPLAAPQFTVQIAVESGEVLSVVLTAVGSEQKGELYESTAQFLS